MEIGKLKLNSWLRVDAIKSRVQHGGMSVEYLKDIMGRFIGTSRTDGNKTTVRDFKSGNIVATYNAKSNTTLDWKRSKTVQGNQAIRFVKG